MDALVGLYFACVLGIATVLGSDLPNDPTIAEYLQARRMEAKVEIAKAYFEESKPAPTKTFDVRWRSLWNESLSSRHAVILNLSNDTFALVDDGVLEVGTADAPLREVAASLQSGSVKFVRSFVWKATLYLLVCQTSDFCSLYTGKDDLQQLQLRQTIRHGGFPYDAAFFAQSNQLHLVVADFSGRFTVPSVIYHWTGTYMDVVTEVTTTGAVSVATFDYKHRTIVVFAQNVWGNSRIGSQVHQFRRGVLERTQFLATDGPVSVRHYRHDGYEFLLVINQVAASCVYWWDGKELLPWFEIPEIKSPAAVEIVPFDSETLFFVSHLNTVSLYKVDNTAYAKLETLDLKDATKIVDMSVRVEGTAMTLTLITSSSDNSYRVHSFALTVKKLLHEALTEEADSTAKCLSELKNLLIERMKTVKEAYESWSFLPAFATNASVARTLNISNLILDNGKIENLHILTTEEEEKWKPRFSTPAKIRGDLEKLRGETEAALATSREALLRRRGPNSLSGNVVVEGDAFFDELHIDALNVETLNGKEAKLDDILSNGEPQNFSTPLRGKIVTVDNLEVESLCGIPYDYWHRASDVAKTPLSIVKVAGVELVNDTIFVRSDLSLPHIRTRKLNNVDWRTFHDDLFLLGYKQIVRGNILYKKSLQTVNLYAQSVNDVGVSRLITRTTDQRLGDVFAASLDVEDLTVQFINGVPVEEAARISRENYIKGNVSISNLRITEELIFDSVSSIPELRSIQVYDDVTIVGDVVLEDLSVDPLHGHFFSNDVEVDLPKLFKESWTKSMDQTLIGNVTFANGVTVDRLDAKFFNGLAEEDYLYTTVEEIPEVFGAVIHFEKFHVNGSVYNATSGNSSYVLSDDFLVVNRRLKIDSLSLKNLSAETYNEIPIRALEKGEVAFTFPGSSYFEELRVIDQLVVDDLRLRRLNGLDLADFFDSAMYVNGSYSLENLTLSRLEVSDLRVNVLNDLAIDETLQSLANSSTSELSVDGDLEVRGNLETFFINQRETAEYFETLAKADIVAKNESILGNLIVRQNFTTEFLFGKRVEDIVRETFSKSGEQTLSGHFSFYDVEASSLTVDGSINELDTKDLIFADEELRLEGDLTFEDLFVSGDVVVGSLNERDVAELYEELLAVPSTSIATMRVDGEVEWETKIPPGQSDGSLSNFFDNAVTRSTDQVISGETTFLGGKVLAHVLDDEQRTDAEVGRILADAVTSSSSSSSSSSQPIAIRGKIFKRDLTVDELRVDGDVYISHVDGYSIRLLNESIVRKFDVEVVSGRSTFRAPLTIDDLYVGGNVHGSSTNELASSRDVLPSSTIFAALDVEGDIRSRYLDGIDFQEFYEDRVTLSGNHEVFDNARFNGRVTVTNEASVGTINGVEPSDFVLKESVDEERRIPGRKTFTKDLIVEGNVYAPVVNGINVLEEYRDGIFNDEDVHVYGDLVFESDVEVRRNVVVVDGTVNGVELRNVTRELDEELEERMLLFSARKENRIDAMISSSLNATQFLSSIFFHLEEEEKLVLRAPNIHKVDAINIDSTTKLNLYGSRSGGYCGLPDNCRCPVQYSAEIAENDCRLWMENDSRTVYNFHEPNGAFGINVVGNTVSSGAMCTGTAPENEFTSVSWMTPQALPAAGGILGGDVREDVVKVRGFLSDVKVFTHNEEIYIVMAIYYDPSNDTHRTNSLVYRLNLDSERISLIEEVPTDGARVVEVFKIPDRGPHVFIGCASKNADSQLFRIDPATSKLELLRTFETGGTRYAKSLTRENDRFLLLDDSDANSVVVFRYDSDARNFLFYQSLYHDSPVNGIEVFYAGEFGYSDAFAIVTTEGGRFFVYEYMFFGLKIHRWLDGVRTIAPFYFKGRRYVFAGTSTNSTIFRIVRQGPD